MMNDMTMCFGCMADLGTPSALVEIHSLFPIPEIKTRAERYTIPEIPAKQMRIMSGVFAGHPIEYADWLNKTFEYGDPADIATYINGLYVGGFAVTQAHGTPVCGTHAYWLLDLLRMGKTPMPW